MNAPQRDYREGDTVILHGTVEFVSPETNRISLQIDGCYGTQYIEISRVKGVFSRHFKKGEKVIWRKSISEVKNVEVICLYGDQAFVALPDGRTSIAMNNELCPQEPQAATPSVLEPPVLGRAE